MQQWNEPETSTIYLANGEQVQANVNGISLEDGSGSVFVHGRAIKVVPLPSPWAFAWSESITVTRTDGSTFEVALTPDQIAQNTAIIERRNETISLLSDNGVWREMSDQERERERRAWAQDMADLEQIRRAWCAYREEEER